MAGRRLSFYKFPCGITGGYERHIGSKGRRRWRMVTGGVVRLMLWMRE